MSNRADTIAVVGMACHYPDAASPESLWRNVLAQRRAFRRFPEERLTIDDYVSSDAGDADTTYVKHAAVIEPFGFDRESFKVPSETFYSTDPVHWLALQVASNALKDAGLESGSGLPLEKTGVLIGNTLTGEVSRANSIRLRWPFVRRVLASVLADRNWSSDEKVSLLKEMETRYKAPFPVTNEETLAGSLSNTISGRIAAHFNVNGGAYTIDAACASSLIAVCTACSQLVAGDLDAAIVGGVDLSLDPMELVGFARAGALARGEMKVFDRRASGFIPGEGCGVLVLMRSADAISQGRRVYGVIAGWGLASDGAGGITRPEPRGQELALSRAYARAGFGIETVDYFEGHGTGTPVGDATELRVLSVALRQSGRRVPATIGSVKANVGHTKAAAGIAGLIKAILAIHHQILPPATACEEPRDELAEAADVLRVLRHGKTWPADRPLRAGVSAMGFGGINSHVVLEGIAQTRRNSLSVMDRQLISTSQDAELLRLTSEELTGLRQKVDRLKLASQHLSFAELTDLAVGMENSLRPGRFRAAVVSSSPEELSQQLQFLADLIERGAGRTLHFNERVFFATGSERPSIGFLFPGQGAPVHVDGGALRRRFPNQVENLYSTAQDFELDHERILGTAIAQPAIATASLAGLRTLTAFGIDARVAIGHSLGELIALHWAGVMDEDALLRVARIRGEAMSNCSKPPGAMASLRASANQVETLISGLPISIAAYNSPTQTVLSGELQAIRRALVLGSQRGIAGTLLRVSHAFHSPLMVAASGPLQRQLACENVRPLRGEIVSTITGTWLHKDDDVRALLCRQLIDPVRFREAFAVARREVDLWIEVGPGEVLAGLVRENDSQIPVVSIDASGPSLSCLLSALGAAFVMGAELSALLGDRFARNLDLESPRRFLSNPCSRAQAAPVPQFALDNRSGVIEHEVDPEACSGVPSPLTIVKQLVARHTQLPTELVKESDRVLGDLHLNSMAVAKIVSEACRRLGLPTLGSATDYAAATVEEIAEALNQFVQNRGIIRGDVGVPQGADSWVRAFWVELREKPLRDSKRAHTTRHTDHKGKWTIFCAPEHPLVGKFEKISDAIGGNGVVLCVPPEPGPEDLILIFDAARAAAKQQQDGHFVVVQNGRGAAALARTVHLETGITTCVVDVPFDHPLAAEWVLAEVHACSGYDEAVYDSAGKRRVRVARPISMPAESSDFSLGENDVLLVTGGGKGITAECALGLAAASGAKVALLGRADPQVDTELRRNLDRFQTACVAFKYYSVDVVDREALGAVVATVETELGLVTAVVHGAGSNIPRPLDSLKDEDFQKTFATKIAGLENILGVLPGDQLRLLVTFGSIIAEIGLPGEADYALANEWLADLTARWKKGHQRCKCVCLEWSVWSGVGMGERLGSLESLVRRGITPISVDIGVSMMKRLVGALLPQVPVIVAGRFGTPPTLSLGDADLPFWRFLEQPRVSYPGVELISDVEISKHTDPYLSDHVFAETLIFPAVMALEAMAQVSMALTARSVIPSFADIHFERPIIVPDHESTTLRIAAIAQENGDVKIVLRCDETDFQVDHFRAVCRFAAAEGASNPVVGEPEARRDVALERLPLRPDADLYGKILFHKGRFARLTGYQTLNSRGCLAEISPPDNSPWFASYLPQDLVLGDPGARDAALHAIQACIPDATILPIGIRQLEPACLRFGHLLTHAVECSQEGDTFAYDMKITKPDGCVVETWKGLSLRKVAQAPLALELSAPLLAPYLERRLAELDPGHWVRIGIDADGELEGNRVARSDRAIRRATGVDVGIFRRPDGKPEFQNGHGLGVSVTHAGNLTLALAGPARLGCDAEFVVGQSDDSWSALLGACGMSLCKFISKEGGDDPDAAATRVWAALECLKKAGESADCPVTFAGAFGDSIIFRAGTFAIFTHRTMVAGYDAPLIFAVAYQLQ